MRFGAAALLLLTLGATAAAVFTLNSAPRVVWQVPHPSLASADDGSMTWRSSRPIAVVSARGVTAVRDGQDDAALDPAPGMTLSPFINAGARYAAGAPLETPSVRTLVELLPDSGLWNTDMQPRRAPAAPASAAPTLGPAMAGVQRSRQVRSPAMAAAHGGGASFSAPASSRTPVADTNAAASPARNLVSAPAPNAPSAPTQTIVADGTLNGFGPLDTVTVLPGGTLAPGASPGILVVAEFILDGGTLEIEILGPQAGDEYDVVHADGVADLRSGTIEIVFVDDEGNVYVPQEGDSFEFLIADGGISGFTDNNQLHLIATALDPSLGFSVVEAGDSLLLQITSGALVSVQATVAAPPTLALMCAVFALCLARRSRQRRLRID